MNSSRGTFHCMFWCLLPVYLYTQAVDFIIFIINMQEGSPYLYISLYQK